jgi:hypothetical protein
MTKRAPGSPLFVIRNFFGFLIVDCVIGKVERRKRVRRRGSSLRALSLSFRNGVITTASPGMATADTANPQPGSAKGSVPFHGLQKVLGTGGFVAASGPGAAQLVQGRRYESLVAADKEPENPFHGGSWSGGGKEAGAAGEFDPFRSEHLKLRFHGSVTGDADDEVGCRDVGKDAGGDGGETAADSVAGDGIAEPAGHRESEPCMGLIRQRQGREDEKPPGP